LRMSPSAGQDGAHVDGLGMVRLHRELVLLMRLARREWGGNSEDEGHGRVEELDDIWIELGEGQWADDGVRDGRDGLPDRGGELEMEVMCAIGEEEDIAGPVDLEGGVEVGCCDTWEGLEEGGDAGERCCEAVRRG